MNPAVRLLLATLFVVVVPAALLVAVQEVTGEAPDLPGPLVALLLVATIVGAFYLFNRPEDRHLTQDRDREEDSRRLGELGELVETEHRIRRLLEVEQGSEGSQYVCELEDGACLLLRGQFLWDYESRMAWPWQRRRKRFPCTRFVLQQRTSRREVVHLVCLGEPLEPETIAPAFRPEEDPWQLFDGEVTRLERSYEDLRRLLLEERPLRDDEP